MRLLLAGALLLVGVAAGSCRTADETVGRLVASWSEQENPAVTTVLPADSSAILVRDQQEWEAWIVALPSSLRDIADGGLSSFAIEDSVVVVGKYPRCVEQSRILDLGEGQLRFDVFTAPEDEGTLCAWAPVQLEVHEVKLADIGVPAASEATLEQR